VAFGKHIFSELRNMLTLRRILRYNVLFLWLTGSWSHFSDKLIHFILSELQCSSPAKVVTQDLEEGLLQV
jgi:hypothetical protein